MDLISIIVPVYKAENYLDQCIQSIVDQTYRNLEIILVDDGSPDRSGELCEGWAKKDSRIRVLHKCNGGLSSARNAGIDHSTGQWLMFIDSDDFVAADMVQKLYDAVRLHDAQVALCGVRAFIDGEDGYKEIEFWDLPANQVRTGRAVLQDAIDHKQGKLGGNSVIACNKIYQKSIFARLRFQEGQLHEDEMIAHHILRSCHKIVSIGEPLYYYRQHAESIMGKGNLLRALSIAMAYGDRILMFDRDGYTGNVEPMQTQYWWILISMYTQFTRDEQCKKLLKKLRHQMKAAKRVYAKSTETPLWKRTAAWLFCCFPGLVGMLYSRFVKSA